MMNLIFLIISSLSLLIWVYLLSFRGRFWQADQFLKAGGNELETLNTWPAVWAIVPARNEAEVLPVSLKSLLIQDYPGQFSIVLIDDQSSDRTARVAQEIAEKLNQSQRLNVISGQPLPGGWSGKLWAMEQGIRHCQQQSLRPDYFLFTDADIEHHQTNLRELVTKAVRENLALTSLMVLLRCESFWEQFLIPAFVFFFQKLYPFPFVNNSQKKMAAAAGGCILIQREALNRIGGLQSLRQALIDDCSLAQAVKSSQSGTSIWLGLTAATHSLRPYPSLQSIWNMVARTAFTQLHYSPWLLTVTIAGMALVYLVSPLGIAAGIVMGNWPILAINLLTWGLMAIAYLPTLKLYRLSPLWGFSLPAIAFLYSLMTVDSALRHWQGRGGNWKGRVYSQSSILNLRNEGR